jgi:hypothetical protein
MLRRTAARIGEALKVRYHPPPAILFKTAGGKRDPSMFSSVLEDGDRLTVFFHRTVGFRGLDGFSGLGL